MRSIPLAACVVAMLYCLGRVSPAFAQTDEIQVYDAAIAPTGAFNLTLHNNFTPSGNTAPGFPGGIVPDHSLNGVAEWAFGFAPWFEGGLYFPLYSITGNGSGFSKLEFVPEIRVAMALSGKYKVALEEYDDFGPISHFLPAAKQSHQLFAVVDVNTKMVGIEAGVGAGLTSASDHWVFKLILSRDL
jgi:hypothetical protein